MSDRKWITDRLPTEADADEEGHVLVQRTLHSKPRHGVHFDWRLVCPGMSWAHSDWWRAPIGYITNDKIAPPKPALAVGQRWRRRDGDVVTISTHDKKDGAAPFCARGHWYRADGTSCTDYSNADLVELIEPATTLRRFVSISRTDWTADESDGYTLDAIADDGTAWWKHSYQAQWTQHPPLPSIEVPADA